jgi:spore coat protein U-like protein
MTFAAPRPTLPRCLLLALLLATPLPGRAANCTVSVPTGPLAFGSYDPVTTHASLPLDSSGQIRVNCQAPDIQVFVAQLSSGAGGSGYSPRRMQLGAERLDYNVYTNAARTVVFGNGSGGTVTVTCTTGVTGGGCTGSNPAGPTRRATLPFYGRIPAAQDAAIGSYSDILTVRIDF